MMFDDDDMICYFCVKCKDVRYFYVVVKFVCPNCSADDMDIDF